MDAVDFIKSMVPEVPLGNFNFGIDWNDADDPLLDDDDDFDDFILGQKAPSTIYKETSDLNTFARFCKSVGESRSIEEIEEKQLAVLLSNFFMKAVNKKGDLYEPDTLTSIRNSLQRVLVAKGKPINIKEGELFRKSREVLAARRKQLKKMGKGNKPNATRPLEDSEVEHLYKIGYFGTHDPVTLQRTVWWNFTKQFGHRARNEARQMKFGDVQIKKEFDFDPNSRECLVWCNERSSKTRDGAKPNGHARAYHPPAYPSNDERCPVQIFRQFVQHRPECCKTDDSPFYLTVRHNFDHNIDQVWYHPKPLGVNKIGEFLSKASSILSAANLSSTIGKISNHSARKTSITKLLSNDVHPLIVSQLSGHKNIDSLNSYYVASKKQQEHMSTILNDSVSKQKLPVEVENAMMQDWNFQNVLSPAAPARSSLSSAAPMNNNHHHPPSSLLYGAFPGASNCNFTINIYNNNNQDHSPQSPVKKRRRIIIDEEE